jgi:hypothetical protein
MTRALQNRPSACIFHASHSLRSGVSAMLGVVDQSINFPSGKLLIHMRLKYIKFPDQEIHLAQK